MRTERHAHQHTLRHSTHDMHLPCMDTVPIPIYPHSQWGVGGHGQKIACLSVRGVLLLLQDKKKSLRVHRMNVDDDDTTLQDGTERRNRRKEIGGDQKKERRGEEGRWPPLPAWTQATFCACSCCSKSSSSSSGFSCNRLFQLLFVCRHQSAAIVQVQEDRRTRIMDTKVKLNFWRSESKNWNRIKIIGTKSPKSDWLIMQELVQRK